MAPWAPGASCATLQRRAAMMAHVRQFFAERAVLEVDTPLLSAAGALDPQLESFRVPAGGRTLFLQTSPESAMKRLLAAGSGSIYQLGHAFRKEEQGRLHNPEFLLLEWYRVGFSDRELMAEIETLVRQLLAPERHLQATEYRSYGALFQDLLGVDVHGASASELAACAHAAGLSLQGDTAAPVWRDLLLTHLIEPQLGADRLTFVYDYPADAAALARLRPGPPPVAARFELYLDGIELANGYDEEPDAGVLRARFEGQRRTRQQQGQPDVPLDTHLLAALEAGLPECAGVALGIDRLLMLALRAPELAQVLPFASDRA